MILPFPLFHNQKGQTGLITESTTDLLILDADLPEADCKLTVQTDLMFLCDSFLWPLTSRVSLNLGGAFGLSPYILSHDCLLLHTCSKVKPRYTHFFFTFPTNVRSTWLLSEKQSGAVCVYISGADCGMDILLSQEPDKMKLCMLLLAATMIVLVDGESINTWQNNFSLFLFGALCLSLTDRVCCWREMWSFSICVMHHWGKPWRFNGIHISALSLFSVLLGCESYFVNIGFNTTCILAGCSPFILKKIWSFWCLRNMLLCLTLLSHFTSPSWCSNNWLEYHFVHGFL